MYFKNKLKDLVTLGSSNLIGSAIQGIFWFYIATILTKSEYGELGYLISLATVAFGISFLGMGVVTVVYESKKENIFPTAFILVLISSGIAAIVSFIIIQNISVSLLIIGLTIFEIILHGLLSKQHYKRYSKHLLLKAVISVILALLFYEMFGINGILLGYFIGSIVVLKELYPLMKNKKIEFSVFRPKIRFVLQAYFIRLSEIIFAWGDKLIIGTVFGFLMLGNYFFAAQYLFLLDTIPRSIAQYLLPQESKGQKNKNLKIFSILLISGIAVVSIIIIPYPVNAWFPKFEDSILPMQILSISIIPTAISQIQISQFLGKENSRIVLIGGILQASLYLFLIILLGSSLGLIGIAMGLLISVIIRAIFNLIIGKIYYQTSRK